MSNKNLPAGTVVQAPVVEPPEFALRYSNLASEEDGASVVACTDEFFAPVRRALRATPPVFIAGKFDENGKWMDGWETRRRRGDGHDSAVIRLACPGMVRGFDIDTTHFTGNYPQAVSIDACHVSQDPDAHTAWVQVLPVTPVGGDAHHFLALQDDRVWTHVRLNMYPDGGVARFKVFGQPWLDWTAQDPSGLHEVSALHAGGRIVSFNNAHFGTPHRLLMPGRGANMGDGWETRRRREPGHDWCIIELGHAVHVRQVQIDTAHFKGNYPESVSVQAAQCQDMTDQLITTSAMFWPELLPRSPMKGHHEHVFEQEALTRPDPVTHVRVNMFPDGGISRVRILGTLA